MLTEEAFSEKNADYNDKFGGNIRMFDGFLRVAAATPDIRVAAEIQQPAKEESQVREPVGANGYVGYAEI